MSKEYVDRWCKPLREQYRTGEPICTLWDVNLNRIAGPGPWSEVREFLR